MLPMISNGGKRLPANTRGLLLRMTEVLVLVRDEQENIGGNMTSIFKRSIARMGNDALGLRLRVRYKAPPKTYSANIYLICLD